MVALLLGMVLVGLPRAATSDQDPVRSFPDPDTIVPVAFAVSGGVSLGSYEAGLNWALLRYFKVLRESSRKSGKPHPGLASVAGASAGAINAFATALTWCVDDERAGDLGAFPDRVDDNLFRDIWMGVGIDDLLPPETDRFPRYRADDGLVSRAAFDPAVRRFLDLLRLPLFRSDCSVPVGLLVTRTEPLAMSVAGVEVRNQRFMIPLELRSAPDGTIRILSVQEDLGDPLLGNVMHLQGRRSESGKQSLIRPEAVIEAILASSAFPVAFGRRVLDHCVRPSRKETAPDDPRCPPGHVPARAEFVDGGLFDNIPLGTAKALAEPVATDLRTRQRWERSGRRYSYIYLDPDNRRSPGRGRTFAAASEPDVDGPAAGGAMTYGLRSQLGFLGGAIKTGRNYELFNVLRGGEWTNQTSVHLEELLAAIDRRQPEAAPVAERAPRAPPAACEALFDSARAQKRALSTESVRTARACLVAQGALLERMYRGQSVAGDPPADGRGITAERTRLIDWMEALAQAIGEDQLALSLTALPADKLGDRRILLATRFPPITGSMLGNFGAFLDRPFREYDYYAGVYDAVHGIAAFFCESAADRERCLGREAREVYRDLGIGDVPDAAAVFGLLARLEHPAADAAEHPWAWADGGRPAGAKPNLLAVHRGLNSGPTPTGTGYFDAPPLSEFVRTLSAAGYDTMASSDFLTRAFRLKERDPLTWYFPITSRASARLLRLESAERQGKPGGAVVSGALAVGALGVHSFIRDEERFSINQSTAPDGTWQSYLPYEIGTDARNGGLAVSWEPALQARTLNLSLNARITPFALNRYGEAGIWYSQIDLLLSYRRTGLFSSFGIGPTFARTWRPWPGYEQATVGGSLYLGLLQDKYRITAGTRSFAHDGFAGDDVYVILGITDIPGIAYWLMNAF